MWDMLRFSGMSGFRHHETTPVGFEPTRGDPIGLAGRRLNRSAKMLSVKLKDAMIVAQRAVSQHTVGVQGNCWNRDSRSVGKGTCSRSFENAPRESSSSAPAPQVGKPRKEGATLTAKTLRIFGKADPARTRTCNLWFRRPTPYH